MAPWLDALVRITPPSFQFCGPQGFVWFGFSEKAAEQDPDSTTKTRGKRKDIMPSKTWLRDADDLGRCITCVYHGYVNNISVVIILFMIIMTTE